MAFTIGALFFSDDNYKFNAIYNAYITPLYITIIHYVTYMGGWEGICSVT